MPGHYVRRPYALPLRSPVGPHRALQGEAIGYCADGAVGWGCAPQLDGWPQHHPSIAAFAADMARHAWLARRLGQPLGQLCSAVFGTVPAAELPLCLTLDPSALENADTQAALRLPQVLAVKIKASAPPTATELAAWATALRAANPRLELRLDANLGWRHLGEAALTSLLQATAEAGYACVEDPVPADKWPVASPVPLACDLLEANEATLCELASAGRLGLAVVKPHLCANVAGFFALARQLAAAQTPIAVSSCMDAPFGLHALAQLAQACPGQVRACGLATDLGVAPAFAAHAAAGFWLPWSDLLAQRALQLPDAPALRGDGPDGFGQWTWRDLHLRAETATENLRARGVMAGDTVALIGANSVQLAVALWAIWRLRAVAAPLHPHWTAAERAAVLDRLRPRLLVTDADHRLAGGTLLDELLAADADLAEPPSPATQLAALQTPPAEFDSHAAAIVATSGSTGAPKLAVLSAGNLLAAAFAHRQRFGGQPGQSWLCPLPLCHAGGLVTLWRAAATGMAVVLVQPSDTYAQLRALRELACAGASLVPLQLQRLIDAGAESGSVQLALIGGGSVPPELLARAQRLGWPVAPTWGMTESAGQLATAAVGAAPGESALRRLVGPPLPGVAVRSLAGGELAVRGPAVSRRYWGEPPRHAATFFHTGDGGTVDGAGNVWVAKQRADRIVRSGENIDPREVEAALLACDGVADAAAVGLADALHGEVVGVWVACAGAPPLARAVQELAPFKRPAVWHVTDQPVPRTAMGKVDRAAIVRTLREKGAPLGSASTASLA